ncbi:MAG TPA: prepilin peptidase [Nitrospirae bacterium]|nr:prepilin peptidase [Nitrospirota bacterium]
MTYAAVLTFGLVIGSFLNVCIYRLPRKLSVVRPASHCPSCGRALKPWDNIPVISYLLLRGRCRYCSARISPRYPLVELLNGLGYMLVLWRFGLGLDAVVYMVYFSTLIVITFIDLDFQIIPDAVTLPGAAAALVLGVFLVSDPFDRGSGLGPAQSVTGLFLGGGLFYAVAVLSRGGMGGGDIKMMAMVGALTGWKGVLLTTFLGSLTGSIVGLGLMIFKGKGRKTKIPFGPFLALGSAVSVLWGQELLKLYMRGYS